MPGFLGNRSIKKKPRFDDSILNQGWIEVFFLISRESKPSKTELRCIVKTLSAFKKLIDSKGRLVGFGVRKESEVELFPLPSSCKIPLPQHVHLSDVVGAVETPFPYFGPCPSTPSSIGVYPLFRSFKPSHVFENEPIFRGGVKLIADPPYSPIELVFDLPVLQVANLLVAKLEETGEKRWPNKKDVKDAIKWLEDNWPFNLPSFPELTFNYQILKEGNPYLETLHGFLAFKYKIEDRAHLSSGFRKVEEFIFGRSLKEEFKIAKKNSIFSYLVR